MIGSASAVESRSSRRLSTEVYLTRIQTRKSPPPLSQTTHSLSWCRSFSLSLVLSRRKSQEQIDKERGSPESFTPGSQPPSSRFLDAAFRRHALACLLRSPPKPQAATESISGPREEAAAPLTSCCSGRGFSVRAAY